VWTGVLRVEPHRGDHRVALRAAISVAVPLLVLWMLGRLDLSIYASFGAFAALYGRHDVFRDRLRMQATAGGVILASMLVGTALSVLAAPAPVSILVVAVIASAVTLLAYTMRWHPPGPLFPVFAVGACATIPATTASFGDVLLVGGPSVLFGLAITALIGVFTRSTADASSRPRQPVGPIAGEMAASVGVAIVGAGFAGLLIMDSHWYWAAVGAVAAVSGPQLNARVIRGIQRLVGTLLGVRRGGDPRDRSAAARRHRARGHAAGRRRAVRRPQLRHRDGVHHPTRAAHGAPRRAHPRRHAPSGPRDRDRDRRGHRHSRRRGIGGASASAGTHTRLSSPAPRVRNAARR